MNPYLKKKILTYKDALVYIQDAYNARGYKRDTFVPAIKEMYDLLIEKEMQMSEQWAKRQERKKRCII